MTVPRGTVRVDPDREPRGSPAELTFRGLEIAFGILFLRLGILKNLILLSAAIVVLTDRPSAPAAWFAEKLPNSAR